MGKPTIALITTVYNDYSIIDRLFNSLLIQNCTNFTHYIYDDGSSLIDKLKIETYIYNASKSLLPYKVHFIKGKKNLDVNKAHEYVFRLIKEDYFCWLDSDDWVNKDFIKTINKVIKSHPKTDVFHINSYRYHDINKRSKHTTLSYRSKSLYKRDQFRNFCLNDDKFFHNFVIKTIAFKEINPTLTILDTTRNNPLWYDAQMLFELAITHKRFYMIKKPLSHIFDRANSTSRSAVHLKQFHRHEDISKLLSICNISNKNIELFYLMLPISEKQENVIELINNKNIKDAKRLYKQNIKYLKNNSIPRKYLPLDLTIKKMLFRHKIRHVVAIINIIKR